MKHTIERAIPACHTEITSLIIPGKNDREEWIDQESSWLAGIDPDTVLHLSRYFPRYHYSIPPTPIEKILSLQKIARKHLSYVYTGNI